MTNVEIFYNMMEEFKQVLAEHTILTAQRDEMMQRKIDSLMFQIKEEVEKIQEQEFLNNELKAEVETQQLLLNDKDAKIHELEVQLKEMELEKSDLKAEIESHKLHMVEKDDMINDQSDMIQAQSEIINDQRKSLKEVKRLQSANDSLRMKNNIAKNQIEDLKSQLDASTSARRKSSIHSIQAHQKYLQIKELYQASQRNWVEAIDVYFKQIESMNEYIETLHAGCEQSSMLLLVEQSIEKEAEAAKGLSPIPEEDEDAYQDSDQEIIAEQEEVDDVQEEEEIMDEDEQIEGIDNELAEEAEADNENESAEEAEAENEQIEGTDNENELAEGENEHIEEGTEIESAEFAESNQVEEEEGTDNESAENEDEYNVGASTSNAQINYPKDMQMNTASTSDAEVNYPEIVIQDEGIEIANESNTSNAESNADDLIHGDNKDSGLYADECDTREDDCPVDAEENLHLKNGSDAQETKPFVLNENKPKAPKKKSKKRGGQQVNKSKRPKTKYVPLTSVISF